MTLQDPNAGFGVSEVKEFVIPSGADGSEVAAIDLERMYAYIRVYCTDADGIDTSITIAAKHAFAAADTLVDVCNQDDPGTPWSKDVPATGSFSFNFVAAYGSRRLQFILSGNTTADVTIKVIGMIGAVA